MPFSCSQRKERRQQREDKPSDLMRTPLCVFRIQSLVQLSAQIDIMNCVSLLQIKCQVWISGLLFTRSATELFKAFPMWACSALSSFWPFIKSMLLFEGGPFARPAAGCHLVHGHNCTLCIRNVQVPMCLRVLPGDVRTGFDPNVCLRVTAHNLHASWPLAQIRTIKNQSGLRWTWVTHLQMEEKLQGRLTTSSAPTSHYAHQMV